MIGGLGVFLLGMKNMSEGMQAVAGSGLRKLISTVTDNRLLAVCVGVLVTSIIQSSSVTTVMVVGLVNSGFMTLMQALGVIFGANIGTTVTAWILTLKIGKYGLPILGVCALIFLFSKKDRLRYLGMTFMGIGMIFFGLELMKDGFAPLRDIPEFQQWFMAFQATTYGGVLKCALAGCILTMIVQSSSATIGITMGLAQTGMIPFQTAAALVLGENIGTTITAYLASIGANTNAKRAAYGHMVFNVLGVLWITAIFPYYMDFIRMIVGVDPNTVVAANGVETFPFILTGIAATHSVFNIANTILFLPFMGVVARFAKWMAPDKKIKEPPHLTYLDVRLVSTPALGIEQSHKELLNMGSSVRKMLGMLRDVLTLEDPDEKVERKIFRREEILDTIQKEIVVYLSDLVAGNIPHEVMHAASRQLRIADEYESLSDYVVNVLKMHIKLRNNEIMLSDEGKKELLDLHDHVTDYLEMVNKAVEEDSGEVLIRAHEAGDYITNLMKSYRREHLSRLTENGISPFSSLVFTDMLNAYRRMKDHAENIVDALAGERS